MQVGPAAVHVLSSNFAMPGRGHWRRPTLPRAYSVGLPSGFLPPALNGRRADPSVPLFGPSMSQSIELARHGGGGGVREAVIDRRPPESEDVEMRAALDHKEASHTPVRPGAVATGLRTDRQREALRRQLRSNAGIRGRSQRHSQEPFL